MADQNDAPPTLLFGLALNKSMIKKEHNEFNLQLELNYAMQNVTAPVNNRDKNFIQLNGFSPGFVASYLVRIGKDRLTNYYWEPALSNHHINFHGAIRPIFFDLKEASGIMLELGLSYRLEFHFVDEYKFKPEFF